MEEVCSEQGISLDHHALGREVGCGSNACVRRPNILKAGVNTVLGSSTFLLEVTCPCPRWRARKSAPADSLFWLMQVSCVDFVAGPEGAEVYILTREEEEGIAGV